MFDYKGLITTLVGVSLLATVGYLYSGVEDSRKAQAEQAVVNKTFELKQQDIETSIAELRELMGQTATKEDVKELKRLTEKLLDLQLRAQDGK